MAKGDARNHSELPFKHERTKKLDVSELETGSGGGLHLDGDPL